MTCTARKRQMCRPGWFNLLAAVLLLIGLPIYGIASLLNESVGPVHTHIQSGGHAQLAQLDGWQDFRRVDHAHRQAGAAARAFIEGHTTADAAGLDAAGPAVPGIDLPPDAPIGPSDPHVDHAARNDALAHVHDSARHHHRQGDTSVVSLGPEAHDDGIDGSTASVSANVVFVPAPDTSPDSELAAFLILPWPASGIDAFESWKGPRHDRPPRA